MKKVVQYAILVCCMFVTNISFSQTTDQLVEAYLYQSASRLGLSEQDLSEWKINQSYEGEKSKITHVYGIQMHNGLEICNTDFNLHIVEKNEVLQFRSNFISNLAAKSMDTQTRPGLTPKETIKKVARQLNLNLTESLSLVSQPSGLEQKQTWSEGGISIEPIPLKLMYFLGNDQQLKLVWDLSIHEISGDNWWSLKVDAASGTILDKKNWVAQCRFNEHNDGIFPLTKEAAESATSALPEDTTNEEAVVMGSYNVYAMPVESPQHGGRTIEVNPDNFLASPFGWHDFTYTTGNNVDAFEAGDNMGFRPNGGVGFNFNFPISFPYTAGNQSEPAAITNLFYWNNIIHDVLYQYGFTEAAGNFQEDNYGRGGVGALGGDSVNARGQSGLWCNATFATPPEGNNPTMRMYIGNCGPEDRDGNYDNPVVAHEYGHGISNRLVGGASNTGCLSNNEQMGEGWSDWYGLMLTMQSTDNGSDSRGIGTWLFGQAANGPGIRAFPYSTDMSVDPRTYDSIMGTGGPHPLGSVWAAMLWEVTWELINVHGFDTDFYNGTGGNNIALHLITEGLKLTPCSPGFVDGRDAILLADQMIYGGANQCAIWRAFAKRGLGASASQGATNNRNDGVEAFDLPTSCCPINLNITIDVPSFTIDHQEAANVITASNTVNADAEAIYHAGGMVILEEGFTVNDNAYFGAYIDGCSGTFVKNPIGGERETIDMSYLKDDKGKASIEESLDENVFLFPNPAESYFDIRLVNTELKAIDVFDINGRLLQSHRPEGVHTIFRIDASNLNTGIYFIHIMDSTHTEYVRRLIVK